MRISSGILRNRQFDVPKKGVRPTMERAREAVFSSLAARVPGAQVLDLFAGSGGFGLEAWSRGAAGVTAVEKDSACFRVLQGNFKALEGDADLGVWQAVQADVYEFLKRGGVPFDLIFADPPYEAADLPALLTAAAPRLGPGGILIFEMRSRGAYSLPMEWKLLKEKVYGEARMLFLVKSHE